MYVPYCCASKWNRGGNSQCTRHYGVNTTVYIYRPPPLPSPTFLLAVSNLHPRSPALSSNNTVILIYYHVHESHEGLCKQVSVHSRYKFDAAKRVLLFFFCLMTIFLRRRQFFFLENSSFSSIQHFFPCLKFTSLFMFYIVYLTIYYYPRVTRVPLPPLKFLKRYANANGFL